MLPVIRILGFTLPVGPLFAVLAFYLGAEVGGRAIGRTAPAHPLPQWQEIFNNAAWVALIVGLIGARLGYAARYYPVYLEAPVLLFSIRPGTLALWPGLLTGAAAALFYLRRKTIGMAQVADAAAIGLCAALTMVSLRNFLLGSDYGAPTNLPWGIDLWLDIRHPVQVYEMALLLIALVILWRYQESALPGETVWRFVAFYSTIELFVTAFRANSSTWLLGIRAAQVGALAVLLTALYILSFYAQRRATANPPQAENEFAALEAG